jgi:hypothetical protein
MSNIRNSVTGGGSRARRSLDAAYLQRSRTFLSFKKKWEWPRLGGTQGVTKKDVLPSHVRLLNLIHFCAYSAPRERTSVALNVDTGRILDSSCIPGGRELVEPKHGLAVDWVGPMVVIDTGRVLESPCVFGGRDCEIDDLVVSRLW